MESPASARPSGTVTFLFTDIEGSTQRWERGPDAMGIALARHNALVRDAIEAHGGYVFKTVGDAFCSAFGMATTALAAARVAQQALSEEDFSSVDGLPVRMALHTGHVEERDGDYLGSAVNRAARLLAIGHGGQVLVSQAAADLVQDSMLPESDLRDLGAHRLKDLTRAERVYQLVAPGLIASFPALRSIEHMPNNLPQQITSFVGRENELAEIEALLEQHRLVTLVGMGGSGKTRCAIQTGAELLDRFVDGVWLIDLASLSDPSLVVAEIAQRLGVREIPNHPLLETLLTFLERRRMLLILDNCEHVIGYVRRVVAGILRGGAGVSVLATSRENLSIAGEHVFRLPSLSLGAAIALFTDRGRAADARYAPVDENAGFVSDICRRLDGLPLAIELAAARVRVLSPQQLAQRLDERFRVLTGGDRSALPRQQTLRATIDWSFDLLDERERALFRVLSLFAGGWTLQAAAAVCSDDGDADDLEMLDSLSTLVDKSLVATEELGDDLRYRMLFSIREYALERLREAGEAEAIAEKHARFYAGFVRELQPLVDALEDAEWRRLLGAEIDNLRTAIEWTIFQGNDRAAGLSLLADLEWPELITNPQEALLWYEHAAELVGEMPDSFVHSRILRHYAVLAYQAGRPVATCERTALHAVEAARATNDANEIARALATLGACYRSAGRFDEAERVLCEAYENPKSLSRITANSVLRIWAVNDLQRGEIDPARRRFSEVTRLERPGSEAHASALLNLGELEFAAGHIDRARAAAQQAKNTYARLNSVYLVLLLSNLAAYAMADGDIDAARGHLRDALDLHNRSHSGWLHMALGSHALLAALLADDERAAALAGFTDAAYGSRGEVRQYTERSGYERLIALLREVYSAGELARRMNEGACLTEEQALAHAAAIHELTSNRAALPPKGGT
ncbi:MAG: adenylate/guanylate cyclase domain-containing protein [Candidatus Cybelea sp.]